MNHDAGTRAALEDFMAEEGFSADTRLYRATLPEFLSDSEEEGVFLVVQAQVPVLVPVLGPWSSLRTSRLLPRSPR